VSAFVRLPVAGVRSAGVRGSLPSHWPILTCGVAAVVGLAGESVAFDWSDPVRWLPDLLVGWTFVAAGVVAWTRVPESRTGPLLAVAGIAWFAGNFASVEWGAAAWLATQAAFVHRGLVIQAIVSFPDGRVSSWSARAAVAAGYAASLAPVARSDVATMVAGAALLAGGLGAVHRARGDLRASLGPPIVAAMLLGAALVLGAVVHLVLSAGEGDEAVLLGYEAVLCLVAVELSAGLLQRAGERAQLSNLVVELGEGHSGSLRDALSKALADPTLEVGYWLSDRDRFVDAAGREVPVPAPGSGRAATTVTAVGQRVALIVHDPVVLDDPTLVTAVSRGASLAAANARLHAQVRGQLAELHESRRRLLDAGDEERRRLESDLHDGVERQLTSL
jgi:signal transduction histidine kinase